MFAGGAIAFEEISLGKHRDLPIFYMNRLQFEIFSLCHFYYLQILARLQVS